MRGIHERSKGIPPRRPYTRKAEEVRDMRIQKMIKVDNAVILAAGASNEFAPLSYEET